MEGKKIYHAGDTGFFGDMKWIGDEGLDVACLPIGDNYTMGPDDALKAIQLLRPKVAIPMHYHESGIAQAGSGRLETAGRSQHPNKGW